MNTNLLKICYNYVYKKKFAAVKNMGESKHMQKIVINNLGAVKEFKSEITKYTVIIGEQGTGKSTIAKSIYYFRNIKTEIIEYLLSIATTGSFVYEDEISNTLFPMSIKKKLKSIFIQLFGYSWDFSELKMSYDFGNGIDIKIDLVNNPKAAQNFINLEYSPKLKNEIVTLEQEMRKIYSKLKTNISGNLMFASQERTRLSREIAEKVNKIFDDDLDTFYIPAGRSLLTLMANQKTRLDYNTIDLVNKNFMNLIESLQPNFDLGIDKVHEHFSMENQNSIADSLSQMIIKNLKGNYKYIKGKEYLVVDENTSIPLNYASSGQQEMLWILNQLYVLLLSKTKSFVIIEEPEAHLFPQLQKDIVDFISIFANLNNSTVFITTHSPYILTSANTLLYAGKLKKISHEKSGEVTKLMGEHRYFSVNDFSAYLLSADNPPENIFDSDICEITAEKIDEVSSKISEEYTKLFYLEEGTK